MKIKSYHILFRLFSYLADKTNGASFFVNYKLMLGTLLIGLTGVSCGKSKQTVTCYVAPIDSGGIELVELDTVKTVEKDSSRKVTPPPPVIRAIESPPEHYITCYTPAIITEDTISSIPSEDKSNELQN